MDHNSSSSLSMIMERVPVFSGKIKSLSGKSWWLNTVAKKHVERLEHEGYGRVVAHILASRGVVDAQAFLYGRMADVLPDPMVLKGMERALEKILPLIMAKKTIALFGDYDVDGMAGCAMLQRYLEILGIPVHSHIPERVEGYGPSAKTVERLLQKKHVALLITIDCGAGEQALLAKTCKSIPVLILDHHPAVDNTHGNDTSTVTMLNPNSKDDTSNLGALSACGVVWMFLIALNRVLRERGFFHNKPEPDLLLWTDLLCLGLLCDVSPMNALNRVLCARGLKQLEKRTHKGLAALLRAGKVFSWPTSRDVVFSLGPLLNAASRMGCAADAYRVLLGKEEDMKPIVERLIRANQQRKHIQKEMMEEALGWIAKKYPSSSPPAKVMILPLDEGMPEVCGIIAGRMAQRFHHAVIVLAPSGQGFYQGSGRAPLGMDLGKALKEADHKGLCSGGGHARAVGLKVANAQLDALEASLVAFFQETPLQEPSVLCDTIVEDDPSLYNTLQVLEPHGEGYPAPLFLLPSVALIGWRRFADIHISLDCLTKNGYPFQATLFHATTSPLRTIIHKDVVHMVGQCAPSFRGKACFVLEDALDASLAPAVMRPSSIG